MLAERSHEVPRQQRLNRFASVFHLTIGRIPVDLAYGVNYLNVGGIRFFPRAPIESI